MRFHPLLSTLAIAGTLLLGVSGAHAALTPPKCLAGKFTAWANLRKCQRIEDAKRVQGKTFDSTKCQTKFQDKFAKLDTKAAGAGIACRYRDNGDGTITDLDTGLMWERKNNITVAENVTWTVALTDVLGACNGTSTDGTALGAGCSIYHDWRIPNILELRTIVDMSRTGCHTGAAACIDSIFEPTAANFHWSATTKASSPTVAFEVNFYHGNVTSDSKGALSSVRAVRSAL